MVNLSVHSDCVCFNNSSVTWSSSASYRVRRRLLSQKLSHQREELVPPPPPPPDPPSPLLPLCPAAPYLDVSVAVWAVTVAHAHQWRHERSSYNEPRGRKRWKHTHTHTHTHTQVCAPGGLRTDNSSSSHRGEKFCQRSHTSFIYYLFIVRNIYYGNVQDERSDEEPVHVRGHQESGAGGELLDVIQSLVRSDFLLLSTSRQVCLCPV